jgi:hypothetical protein
MPMTLPWMAAKIQLRPAAELRAHPGNARVHTPAQVEQIKASMLAFGFTNPLLVDETGALIAGHGRLEAALSLGVERVPAIVLPHLSAAQKEALRLADNRIAENRAPPASSRQASPAYSRGAARSSSSPFLSSERNTALRAAAGSVFGAAASCSGCWLALLRIRPWVSESFIVGVSGAAGPGHRVLRPGAPPGMPGRGGAEVGRATRPTLRA